MSTFYYTVLELKNILKDAFYIRIAYRFIV